MRYSTTLGVLALAAAVAAIAPALVAPAEAGGWHRGRSYAAPQYYRSYRMAPRYYRGGLRYYNSPSAYRAACGYGDCACLHSMAVRTGNPVWWDKYQACTG
jgi:hypothetical protein